MTMGSPHVEIECDGIECENILKLCLTYENNRWDNRNIQYQIDETGWITKGDEHFCEGCQETDSTKRIDNRDILLACRYRGLDKKK